MTPRTITTEASGCSEAVPDLATVEAVIRGEGDSASDARAITNDRAATLRASITAVAPDQVRTVELQVQESAEVFDPVTDAPFQATERLHIECVPAKAESVVVEITDAGGQIQSVQFHLHEDKHRELQNKSLSSAMERAREKAMQMAAAEGFAVAEMQEATTRDVSSGLESIVDEALASTAEVDLHPAPITVSESVEVVYEVSEE